jgi:hypothetical protein
MTIEFDVVKRIHSGEHNFDSDFTVSSDADSFRIMSVDEEGLFKGLSHEEKLELAVINYKRPILNIWKNLWMYIEEIHEWVCIHQGNSWNSELNWSPSSIKLKDNFLLDVEEESLYKLYIEQS